MDRHYSYITFNAVFFLTAITILSHWRSSTSTLSRINLLTENLMGFTLLFGSVSAMLGMLTGSRYLLPKIDIRDTYTIAQWATIPSAVALAIYTIAATPHQGFLDFPSWLIIGIIVVLLRSWLEFKQGRLLVDRHIKRMAQQ
jgi:membrane protein DedA with SNARE-associated domain